MSLIDFFLLVMDLKAVSSSVRVESVCLESRIIMFVENIEILKVLCIFYICGKELIIHRSVSRKITCNSRVKYF